MLTAGFSLAFIVTQKVSYGKSVTASSTYKKRIFVKMSVWLFTGVPLYENLHLFLIKQIKIYVWECMSFDTNSAPLV